MIESDFGQQVSIFSKNHLEIAKMVDGFVNLLSRVNVNTQSQREIPDVFPFTGRKDSAEGTFLYQMRCALSLSERWWQPKTANSTKIFLTI